MKKTLIALAALASTAAFAQSNVTLFGNMDLSVANVKQGNQSLTSMARDGISTSAWGLRGTEDLGGGLKAGFHVESTIISDTGGAGSTTVAGQLFDRRSIVTLGGSWGEVRLGRDYVPTFWSHLQYNPFGVFGVGAGNATYSTLGSGSTTTVRADNLITYQSPSFSGFAVDAAFSLKESKAANTANEYSGIRVTYNQGPLSVAVATGSEGSIDLTQSHKRTNIGAAYDFGVAKAFFLHVDSKFGQLKQKQTTLGVAAPVGPGTLKLAYVRADENAAAGNDDANHWAIGYVYPMSKRTSVYGTYARISNKNGANFSVAGTTSATAAAVTAGGTSSGFQAGIRHSF